MKRKRLLWQIYIPVVLVIVTSVFAATWYAGNTLRDFSLEQTKNDLATRAGLISKQIAVPFFTHDYDQLKTLCKQLGLESATRITIILNNGTVLADSMEAAAKMDNHGDRIEVSQALSGTISSSIRYSKTLHQNMLYLAMPLIPPSAKDETRVPANDVLRLAIPITSIDQALHKVITKIVLSALILVLIAAAITLSISRKITKPLEEIRLYAERLASDDLKKDIILIPEKDISIEVADLATSMNMMASQFNDRFQILTKQRNELEAVFSSMAEAVIVVDNEKKIISMNDAATRLPGVFSPATDLDNPPSLANPEMIEFSHHVLAKRQPLEEEIILNNGQDKIYLQAHGTLLVDAQQKRTGALIVLHDVTRLRRLEDIRRDFVANVSHELKTPITTIKGFVETLQDGAISCPEDADRFLGIILKHADRLNAIVDDLLILSSLEQEDEIKKIDLTPGRLQTILANAMETCSAKAHKKNITLALNCSEQLFINMDEQLLEQAVINLIVNAIKYSPENNAVHISASQTGDAVIVSIEDFGVGIAAKHLPRLFERFYRSDRARSRKLGGTGLGLSIVKHIAQAHGGTVTVTSTPDQGSTFTIHLPA